MGDGGYRLLVFDWDGTLMDSIATIVACTRAAIADVGLEPGSDEEVRAAVGLGLRECMERLHPGCAEHLYQPLVERYRERWLAEYKDHPVLFSGAAEVVRELAGAGYLLGVATAKGRRGLVRELDRTGLAPLFAATRTVDEAPSKPHPGMLLGLMEETGVGADETLMIGDTQWDLEMARNAGCAGVGVLTGSHGRAELDGLALACLESVCELPAWLGSESPRRPLLGWQDL
jgi:phosphoglycolate phosphatase